jgi:phosphohistidine swiveling domain-containing protein
MNKAVVTSHQPSMTEWFAAIGAQGEADAFRAEDNAKATRLENLFQTIGSPYERPTIFPARALADRMPEFLSYLDAHGDELCAIRLVPNRPDLPKLRQRGLSLRQTYDDWFHAQHIDPDAYTANIYEHSERLLWSATLVVNKTAIFGEIIRGLHSQLTHGDTTLQLIQFSFNFSEWMWSVHDAEAVERIQTMIKLIFVPDRVKQDELRRTLKADFSHDYLVGYFEFTIWPDGSIYLIDYNRMLPKLIPAPPPIQASSADLGTQILIGQCAQPGSAQGVVRIVDGESIANIEFPSGAILVCDNTDVRFLPLMRRAGAIVTNRGGILTHAAIIARELKKPCIIGTKIATKVLKDGDLVEVDATKGIVRKL